MGIPQWHSRSSQRHELPASSYAGALAAMRHLSGTIAYILEDMEEKSAEAQNTQRGGGLSPASQLDAYDTYDEGDEVQAFAGRPPTPKFLSAAANYHQRRPLRHSCQKCRTTQTPKWRKGPDGHKSLCNVCGLMFAKQVERVRSQA